MSWVEVGRFEDMGYEFQTELSKIKEFAIDVAFDPESVINIQETDKGYSIYIHPEFYTYFSG